MKSQLNQRQCEVLDMIVRRYVETAEPVGSRYISRKLDLSSATIRNVMADLEDAGFIMQPHTSAGRAPTDKGYRYYIESLMHLKNVKPDLQRTVKNQYVAPARSVEDVLERASNMLSNVTNYVGLTLFSEYNKLYLDGTSHIIEQPEFHDLRKLYALLKCLEQKRDLLDLLKNDFATEGVTIHIGRENFSNSLSDCSVVTKAYKVKGRASGRLGVIGPKRMTYERVIPMVEYLADRVTGMFDDMGV